MLLSMEAHITLDVLYWQMHESECHGRRIRKVCYIICCKTRSNFVEYLEVEEIFCFEENEVNDVVVCFYENIY